MCRGESVGINLLPIPFEFEWAGAKVLEPICYQFLLSYELNDYL
jgi:hypothetical protein